MPLQKYHTILLFGPPGVGKGTQGHVLGRLPGFLHVASGDCLRALPEDSPEAKLIRPIIDRGELVSDDLMVDVWKRVIEDFIARGKFDPVTDLLVLDGIPRSVAQAKALDDHVDVRCLIRLVCADVEEIVQRIKGRATNSGRPDDADDAVIRHRIDVYRQQTKPVLNYYPDELKHEIDALGTPAEVLRSILDRIILLQSAEPSGAST